MDRGNLSLERTIEDRFDASIKSLLQSLESKGFSDSSLNGEDCLSEEVCDLVESVEFSRSINVNFRYQMNGDRVSALNTLYEDEAEAIEDAHSLTLSSIFATPSDLSFLEEPETEAGIRSTPEEEMLYFGAARENLMRQTDLLTRHHFLVTNQINKHLFSAVKNIPLVVEAVLEEVFAVCQHPNAAERLMLSRAFKIRPGYLMNWFVAKAESMKTAFVANANIRNKGRLARAFRNRGFRFERGLQEGETTVAESMN